MLKKIIKSEEESLKQKQLKQKFQRQKSCSHSFNSDEVCEYCGVGYEDYCQSVGDGEEIGSYN